jgi:hypothetical protein
MTPSPPSSLEREFTEGLPRLSGADISGTLPLSEWLLNEMIPHGGPISELRLLDGNRFTVRSSLWHLLRFRLQARLLSVDVGLNVTLELQGHLLKRRALELVASHFPHVSRGPGHSLIVAAGEFPAVARYRHLWRYLTHLALRTRQGTLVCDFAFSR